MRLPEERRAARLRSKRIYIVSTSIAISIIVSRLVEILTSIIAIITEIMIVAVMVCGGNGTLCIVTVNAAHIEPIAVLVLVLGSQIAADRCASFEIAAAMEVAGIIGAASAVVDCRGREGTQRTRARRWRADTAFSENTVRRLTLLDPIHQRKKRIDHRWPRSTAEAAGAMTDAWHRKKAIPGLEPLEISFTVTVPGCNAPIVIDIVAPADRAVLRAMNLNDLRVMPQSLVENWVLVVREVGGRVRSQGCLILVGDAVG